ncbi:hypothetical protein LguiA_003946 [Lonicera macranthoides]
MNPPIEGWFKIFDCGAQSLTIIPLSPFVILSSKPSGSQLSFSFFFSLFLTTHIKLWPDASSP